MKTSRPSRRLSRYSLPVNGRPFLPMKSSAFVPRIGYSLRHSIQVFYSIPRLAPTTGIFLLYKEKWTRSLLRDRVGSAHHALRPSSPCDAPSFRPPETAASAGDQTVVPLDCERSTDRRSCPTVRLL